MHIVIDLIVVAIFAVMILISAKRGFVRVVVETVGILAVLVVVAMSVNPLADVTYQKVIEPPIINSTSEVVFNSSSDAVESVWESLPTFVTENVDEFGITKEKIKEVVVSEGKADAKETLENISQKLIKPAVVTVLEIFYAVILILLLSCIVKLLAGIINKAFSFKKIGKLNTTLGGVLGVVKGFVTALIFCNIVELAIKFIPNGIWIFSSENIAKTYLFNLLTNVF
jgi:uncharacterized membrane protein required for colicin V production